MEGCWVKLPWDWWGARISEKKSDPGWGLKVQAAVLLIRSGRRKGDSQDFCLEHLEGIAVNEKGVTKLVTRSILKYFWGK